MNESSLHNAMWINIILLSRMSCMLFYTLLADHNAHHES